MREPDGRLEGIRWWLPVNGETTICVEDQQTGIIVKGIADKGETTEQTCKRLANETEQIALKHRRNISTNQKPSDTMPQ
ncbi:hypothetical protein AUJ46_02815 [Candidatus Peregrinibacteria bacterium CG1_02_54_53]|nr:MAG: hypothetical protein AUJ46_02815 [Candidatus Peregrinibacteria bacterium CG1_02_54_53]